MSGKFLSVYDGAGSLAVGLSLEFWKALGEPARVYFFFDPRRRVLGLQKAPPTDRKARLVCVVNSGAAYVVSHGRFLRRHHIGPQLRVPVRPWRDGIWIAAVK